MSHRFYISAIDGDQAVLTGSEAHHLIHVMRAQVGSTVVLFDGRGAEFAAEVMQIGRTEVRLAVGRPQNIDRELDLDITLGVALPKGDRQRWLVEKAVELGVRGLVPLRTDRGVSQPGKAALERLHRAIVEASKQCGRNRLMELESPRPLSQYVAEAAPDALRWMAHPGGRPVGELLSEAPGYAARGKPRSLAIGPEGGFTEEEVAQARRAGWQPVDLGPRTLRIETAALALTTLVAVAQCNR